MKEKELQFAAEQERAKAAGTKIAALTEKEEELLSLLKEAKNAGGKTDFDALSLKAAFLLAEIESEMSRLEVNGTLSATQQAAILKQMAARVAALQETIAHADGGQKMAKAMGDTAEETEKLAEFAKICRENGT